MKLNEAIDILHKSGFLLEDTETQDDEYSKLHREYDNAIKYGPAKSDKLKNRKLKLYYKHLDLEDKTKQAIDFNMRNLIKGILKGLIDEDYTMVGRDILDYNDKENYQLVKYGFTDNRKKYYLEVKYYDDGSIKLQLTDENDIEIEKYDFSITTIEKAIEVVIDFVNHFVRE